MAKTEKIFRDPLYNYVAIRGEENEWLLDLIDTVEVQRLRRIHQLGVSHFTYPGADHTRFSHALGVLHLMQQAWQRIEALSEDDESIRHAYRSLLAAAVLHDVGHGPFSHLFEPVLKTYRERWSHEYWSHEHWSCEVIRSADTEVHQELLDKGVDVEQVASLIEKDNEKPPPWQKTLLSSQLDVDRLDYLQRDSYFTGSGYGHYDWYRILNSFSLHEKDDFTVLVWPEKAVYAIEEYIFSRFYMYNNVYQHKTTRGFEKLLQAACGRAKQIHEGSRDARFVDEIAEFLDAETPTVKQYLALEDATLVYQLQLWSKHPDRALSDLAGRFLARKGFAAIEDPVSETGFDDARAKWETTLRKVVAQGGFEPEEFYVLHDELEFTMYDPYIPEKEEEVQDPYNAIFIKPEGSKPLVEVSRLLERLASVAGARSEQHRYYVPKECRDKARQIAESQRW
ncbi:MAG: HD domain-containing protein [Pirellulales bacterium]|nr:HD domain-containing protein [Pirellulales bacterium]